MCPTATASTCAGTDLHLAIMLAVTLTARGVSIDKDRLAQVAEVAVIGVPHPHWVEAVVAIVVVKAGQSLDEQTVLAHCAALMASFKAPKRVLFVDTLPKNPSGKLLKRELRELQAGLFAES